MKRQLILKGFHRPLSLIPPFLRRPKKTDCDIYINKRIIFTDSCRYSLDGGDQDDWNKLFGFCFGIFGIHKNSARAVWRYVPESDHIEIALYTYINGERDYQICTSVPINSICTIDLSYNRQENSLRLHVGGVYCYLITRIVSFPDKPVFGCGLYFGGNRHSPHNIMIYEY